MRLAIMAMSIMRIALMFVVLLASVPVKAQLNASESAKRGVTHTVAVNGGLVCITSKLYTPDGDKSWLCGIDMSVEYDCVFYSGYGFGLLAERSSTDYGGDYINITYLGPSFVMAGDISDRWRGKMDAGAGYTVCDDGFDKRKGFGLRASVGVDYKLLEWLGVGAELTDYLSFYSKRDRYGWGDNGNNGIQRFALTAGLRVYF